MTPPRIDIPPRHDALASQGNDRRRSRSSSLASGAGATQHKLAAFFGETPPSALTGLAGKTASVVVSPPPQLDLHFSPIGFASDEVESALSPSWRNSEQPSSLTGPPSSTTWASTDRSASIKLTPLTSPRLSVLSTRFSLRRVPKASPPAASMQAVSVLKLDSRSNTSSKDTASTDESCQSSDSLERTSTPLVTLSKLTQRTRKQDCSSPLFACEYWMLSRTVIIEAALERWSVLKGITLHKRGWRTRDIVLASNAKPNANLVSPIVFDFDEEACGGAAFFASLHSFKQGKGGARVELQRLVLSSRSFVAVADTARRYGSGQWSLVVGGAEASHPQVQHASRSGHTEEWLLQLDSLEQLQLWQTTLRALVAALCRAEDLFRVGKRSSVLSAPAVAAPTPASGLGISLGSDPSARRSLPVSRTKSSKSANVAPPTSPIDEDADLRFSINQTPSAASNVLQAPRSNAVERIEALEVLRPGSSTDLLLKEEQEPAVSRKSSGLTRSSSLKQLHSVSARSWASSSTDTINSEPAFHLPSSSYLNIASLTSPTSPPAGAYDEEDRESLYSEPDTPWSPSHRDSNASFLRVRSRSNSTCSDASHFSLSRSDLPPRAPVPRTAPPPVPDATLSPTQSPKFSKSNRRLSSQTVERHANVHPFTLGIVSPSSSPFVTLEDAMSDCTRLAFGFDPTSPSASSCSASKPEPLSPASTLPPLTPSDVRDSGRFADVTFGSMASSAMLLADEEATKTHATVNKERKQALLDALSLSSPCQTRIIEPTLHLESMRKPKLDITLGPVPLKKMLHRDTELDQRSHFFDDSCDSGSETDSDSDEGRSSKVTTTVNGLVELVQPALTQGKDSAPLVLAHRHSQSAEQLHRSATLKYTHTVSPSLPSSLDASEQRFTFVCSPRTPPSNGRVLTYLTAPNSAAAAASSYADLPASPMSSFAQPGTPLTADALLKHFPSPPRTLPSCPPRSRQNSSASEGGLTFALPKRRVVKAKVGLAL